MIGYNSTVGVAVAGFLIGLAPAQRARGEGYGAHRKLRPTRMGEVRWTTGFWAEKFELCRRKMLPAIRQALLDPRNSELLSSFRIAAGLDKGPRRGTDWSDGDCYKWLEAVSLVYAVTKDPKLDRMLDKWIAIIAKAQRPDGFISTNALRTGRRKPLDMPYTHQLYNMGHLLTAACVHHDATGKDSFLRIAVKTADYLDREFRPRPARLVHFPWNPSVYVGLVDLYRATGRRKYLELAQILIDNRGSSPGGGTHRNGGTDQTQDRVPIRKETQAVGHAVCGTYLYCGAADLYAETGEAALLKALERIWLNVVSRRMYITGAVGVGGGKSPRGDPVHEAFAADYHLPSRSAYAETCSNIGNAMWNWRMLNLTADAKYGDMMEQVLYNSMLSPVSLDGTKFFYCNPLRWQGEGGGPSRHHTAVRWSIHSCYCCPPQVARKIAGLGRWAYGLSDRGVWVHLYGSNVLKTRLADGSPLRLTQETDYPWDGRVMITLAEAPRREVALMLRIPAWARGARITVNGKALAGPVSPGSYATVRRRWSAGDVVELHLPLPVRVLEANPKVSQLPDKVTVMRGPIVYCLELPLGDNGRAVWRDGVFLPENIKFTPHPGPKALGRLIVLKGKALTSAGRDRYAGENSRRVKAGPAGDWGNQLYRKFRPRGVKGAEHGTVDITLIPYFAWANRGVAFMEVWIPLAR